MIFFDKIFNTLTKNSNCYVLFRQSHQATIELIEKFSQRLIDVMKIEKPKEIV